MKFWEAFFNGLLLGSFVILVFIFGAASQSAYDRRFTMEANQYKTNWVTCEERLKYYLNDTEHCLSVCSEHFEKFAC